ncbi:MAG: hypothetical protein J2P32_14010, partial [Actinobacteria bacterium]|nr:hypothetical protein [Actinomycetota bacterium]
CVPHRRLLLAGCESVTFSGLEVRGALQVRARRRPAGTAPRQGASGEAWDVTVLDVTGQPVVAWHGLRVREAGPLGWGMAWHPALLAASLEGRAIERGLHPTLRVTVTSGRVPELEAATAGVTSGAPPEPGRPAGEQRARAGGAITRPAGHPRGRDAGAANPEPGREPGRAPVAWADTAAGRWQLAGLELSVQAAVPVACRWQAIEQPADDLPEPVADASDEGLAALRRQLAARPAEPAATSEARFRVVAACLAAMGRKPGEPLLLEDGCDHGWIAVRTARAMVSCGVVEISGVPGPAAVAIAAAAPAASRS